MRFVGSTELVFGQDASGGPEAVTYGLEMVQRRGLAAGRNLRWRRGADQAQGWVIDVLIRYDQIVALVYLADKIRKIILRRVFEGYVRHKN